MALVLDISMTDSSHGILAILGSDFELGLKAGEAVGRNQKGKKMNKSFSKFLYLLSYFLHLKSQLVFFLFFFFFGLQYFLNVEQPF